MKEEQALTVALPYPVKPKTWLFPFQLVRGGSVDLHHLGSDVVDQLGHVVERQVLGRDGRQDCDDYMARVVTFLAMVQEVVARENDWRDRQLCCDG